MSLIADTYHALTDSLFNLITGLGTAKDPRTSSQFYFRELDRNVLEQMYRSDWMARRIVDLPAADATREWRQWSAARPQLEKIDNIEKKFDIQKKMRLALVRARLYGGGALVLGVDQGQPQDELDLDAVGLDDLKFVVVVNRYELAAGPRIYNVDSPWYTRPEYYTVATPMFGFFGESGGAFPGRNPSGAPKPLSDPAQSYGGMVQVHPSRVVEFSGNELPDWRLAPMGGGWGDSVLQTVDDSLRDFAMITSGLASMINDMKMDVVRVPDLSRKLSTADLTAKTMQRFGLANQAKSTINTLLLDKEEEWQRITTSFGSTPELIKVAMTIACAAGGVPESRIMGSAPSKGLAGEGKSGGEIDIRNYFDDISSQQKSVYKPMMAPLDRCIQQSATGKYDPSIDYEWQPLYQLTPAELATTALAKAQTTQVYVSSGLFNEDMLREATISQLTEDNVYPGLEDAIDEYGSEPEEPEPQAMPTPPPGMVPKGAFEANPYHMLKAQASIAAGQPPPKFPPNKPQLKPPAGKQPVKDWSEDQPRDDQGRWASGGGGAGGDDQASVERMARQLAPQRGAEATGRQLSHASAVHAFMSSPAVRAGVGVAVAGWLGEHAIDAAHAAGKAGIAKAAEFALDGALTAVGVHIGAPVLAAGAIAVIAGVAAEHLGKKLEPTIDLGAHRAASLLATTGRSLLTHYHALKQSGAAAAQLAGGSFGDADDGDEDSVLEALTLLVPAWEQASRRPALGGSGGPALEGSGPGA